jgi:hypothetical protein
MWISRNKGTRLCLHSVKVSTFDSQPDSFVLNIPFLAILSLVIKKIEISNRSFF